MGKLNVFNDDEYAKLREFEDSGEILKIKGINFYGDEIEAQGKASLCTFCGIF